MVLIGFDVHAASAKLNEISGRAAGSPFVVSAR
jgi:hypothetical protein